MAELSIAIADDNRQTLNLLGEILEKEDGIHVVGKADNGEDAYNMIVRTNPDIVLMDVIMPRLDGISVMEKIKNNTQMKNHPSFIMVTAASSQVDRGCVPPRSELLYHETVQPRRDPGQDPQSLPRTGESGGQCTYGSETGTALSRQGELHGTESGDRCDPDAA